MLATYIAIGVGGALGAIARFAMARMQPPFILTHFPLQIFLINALGCLVMGLLVEFMALYWSPPDTLAVFLNNRPPGGIYNVFRFYS